MTSQAPDYRRGSLQGLCSGRRAWPYPVAALSPGCAPVGMALPPAAGGRWAAGVRSHGGWRPDALVMPTLLHWRFYRPRPRAALSVPHEERPAVRQSPDHCQGDPSLSG